MHIACPSCTTTLKAPEQLIGKRVKCPRCGEPVLIEAPATELDDFLEDGELEASPPVRSAGRQTCPMCGASNKSTAAQCSECGEELSGGADGGEGLWRDGKKLVMRKTAKLPYRCVKANGPAEGWLKRRLYWHHPAVYLTLFLGLLIYVIVALCVQKKATIEVGLSQPWFKRRLWAMLGGWLAVLAGIGLCIAGCAGMNTPGNNGGWIVVAGLIIGLAGAITGLVVSNIVSPAKITDEFVWLNGVHPDFLADLPVWRSEFDVRKSRK